MLDTNFQQQTKNILKSGVQKLLSLGIKPNYITILGLILGVSAAFSILINNTVLTLVLLYLSGICDVLDGNMAREQGGGSPLGAMMDIVFDRIVEVSVILVFGIKYPEHSFILMFLLISIIICMSVFLTIGILISNKSQKSFFYAPGIMERTETFILFTLLILFQQWLPAISLLGAFLIVITGIQRFIQAMKFFKEKDNDRNKI